MILNYFDCTNVSLNLPMYPGTCLLAPLGSTKFNVTILSKTDGVVDSVVGTADERNRDTLIPLDKVRFDEEVNRRNIVSRCLSGPS